MQKKLSRALFLFMICPLVLNSHQEGVVTGPSSRMVSLFRLFTVTLLLWIGVAVAQRSVEDVFENIDKNYNRNVMPPTQRGPVMIGITMHVLSLPKVDDINMEFHMDMYFRQFWNDNRLAFSKRASPTSFDKIKHPSLKTRVWVPDPFFVNQKEGKVLDNPADNTLFTIERNGNVMYSSRQLVTTACMMDLTKYPFDVQECRLDIESFSHNTQELLYHYKEGNSTLSFDKGIDIPHFTLLGHKLEETFVEVATGRYNRLWVKFFVKRDPQRYMHNAAIPSAIVVLVSSITFWIDPVSDGGARGLMILVSALFLTGIYLNTASAYLVLNYYTLSDLFFFNCYGFLLLNALVFLLVLIVGRSAKSREEAGRGGGKCLRKCCWLDVVFRLVFVPLFLVYFVIFATSTTGDSTGDIDGLIPYKY